MGVTMLSGLCLFDSNSESRVPGRCLMTDVTLMDAPELKAQQMKARVVEIEM